MGWIVEEVGGSVALFTDRHGGVSPAPYDSANMAAAVGDARSNVVENRRRAGASLGGAATDLERWVFAQATHGGLVAVADASHLNVVGDAVVTTDPTIALSYRVADCAPLVLATVRAVAAVHVGWRGIPEGVIEAAVAELRRLDSGSPIEALVGPVVGPCCYDLPESNALRVPEAAGQPTGTGRVVFDIESALTARLRAVGVELQAVGVCTSCSPNYFSRRRDGQRTGNQAVVVRLAS